MVNRVLTTMRGSDILRQLFEGSWNLAVAARYVNERLKRKQPMGISLR